MLSTYKFNKISKILKYGIEIECTRFFTKVDNKFLGKWVKNKVVSLGPTFIKIGQLMSSRKDVFGKEFTDELKDLQDNISPVTFDELRPDFKTIHDQFQFIEEIPFASASIGQVHKARLISGEDVVIKARRPDICENINDDFELISLLLDLCENVISSPRILEIRILFQEYYSILKEEIDFEKEKNNMLTFQQMFSNVPWIKIPRVYENASNSNIITMEYVPSIKIDNKYDIDKLKFNKSTIADKLIESYITQIIDFGIIHLDPHPGNIGIVNTGKIVFYDFGMILTLEKKFRESFDSLLFAIYKKDVDLIAQITVDNGFVILEDGDVTSFKKFLSIFLNYIDTLNVNNFKIEYIDVFDKTELNFMMSSKFVMLLRGITILEGVCKDLDPNFNYSRSLDKYINKFFMNIETFERKFDKDLREFFSDKNNNNRDDIQSQIKTLQMRFDTSQTEDTNGKIYKGLNIFFSCLILIDILLKL